VSSLSDLLLHELKHQPGVSLDDVMEELAFPAKWDPEGVAMEDGQFAGAQQGTDITGLYSVPSYRFNSEELCLYAW